MPDIVLSDYRRTHFSATPLCPVTGMAGHVLLDPTLAGNIAVPLLEGGIYIGLA